MQSLILAGGLGTRLGPLAGDIAKPMQPVAGRPFLDLLLRYFAGQGISEFILCVGHQAESIREHFGDGSAFGVRIRYSMERAPLGTGGALRYALPLIDGERMLVSNGDSFVDFALAGLVHAHERLRPQATVVLAGVDDAARFGAVELDAGGRVTAFREKGSDVAGLVNAGVYVLERALIERFPAEVPVSLERDCLPGLAAEGQVVGMPVEGRLIDIGTPESLRAARTDPLFVRLAGAVPC
jgi:NDP-sugar pyrophosphorylase family protein